MIRANIKAHLRPLGVVKIEILKHNHKIKVGQKLSSERFNMIVENLQKRGKKKDLETIEKMKEFK